MIRLKNDKEIIEIRKSCHLLADLFNEIIPKVKPGVSTKQIDEWCVEFMTRYVKNTEQYYYGKFSYELDRKCLALKKRLLDKTSYDYIIDRTFSFPG